MSIRVCFNFCLVLVYVIWTIISQPILPFERTFQWQVHSFNDKRELTQLLKKGTTLFKIDLYYQTQSKCYTKDTRATKDKRGCFILTHDRPTSKVSYDSIYDYIDEIIKHQSYFNTVPYTLSLALCFKNTPNICNGLNQNWLSLVDELYELTERVKREYNLALEFIYDGKKEKCIRDKWPQWKYTWIRGSDPAEAFISNDKALGYDKFNIFNDAERDLKKDAALNWGKFSQIKRPLQVWEPNNQEPILSVANVFTDHPHAYGYAYAINIDTSMYQVYTAPISREDFNENIIKDKTVSMEKSSFTIVLMNKGKYLYLFIGGRKVPLLNIYQIVNKNIVLIKSISLPSNQMNSFREVIHLGNNSNNGNRDYFIVRGANDDYCLIELEEYALIKAKCGLFYSIFNDHYVISSISIINQDTNTNSSNVSLLVAYVVNKANIQFNIVTIDLNTSLDIRLVFKMKNLLLLTHSINELNVKCNNHKCLVLYNSSADATIKSQVITLINNQKDFNVKEYRSFGLGRHFSLSLVNHNSILKFLIAKDHGFCYHNEPSNKDAYTLMCDQKEIEMNHVLNYIHGEISDDLSYDVNDNASSVCSKDTITGSYDMGDFPQVNSFITCTNQAKAEAQTDESNNSNCNFEFYELHNGIDKSTKDIHKDCGVSRFYDGIVLDSWHMLSLLK